MNILLLIFGVSALVRGLPMVLVTKQAKARADASRAGRLAELHGGASELYFEESRALKAYPLPRTESGYRLWGVGLVALGLGSIVMGVLDRP